MVKTYAEAGVDQEEKAATIGALAEALRYRRTGRGAPLAGVGPFAGLIDMGDFALALSADGVGTKLLVAKALGKWDTVGIDCVAMNANDMICVGAEPLAFVDYFAVHRYDEAIARQVGVGLNRGAERANVTVVGGEVSIMPEVLREYDLAGACVGIVAKDAVLTGDAVRPGDAILGVASTGIHSNGLTLARKVFAEADLGYGDALPGDEGTVGEALLEPTAIYVRPVLRLMTETRPKGVAHITGGGVRNLLRLNRRVGYEITDPLPPQPVFRAIQELAGIADREMYQTFNMGMGLAVIVAQDDAAEAQRILAADFPTRVVGRVVEGGGVTVPPLDLAYDRY